MTSYRLADVMALSPAEFKKLSTTEKKQAMRAVSKALNRNLTRLREEYDDDENAATMWLMRDIEKQRKRGTWGPAGTPVDRFSVKGLSDKQLSSQFVTAKRFYLRKGSSLKGAHEIEAKNIARIDEIITAGETRRGYKQPVKNWYKNLTKDEKREFWHVYNGLAQNPDIQGASYKKGSDGLIEEIEIVKKNRPDLSWEDVLQRMYAMYYDNKYGKKINQKTLRKGMDQYYDDLFKRLTRGEDE